METSLDFIKVFQKNEIHHRAGQLCPKEKGIQSQNHFQLRGKTWTAPTPNNIEIQYG